MIHDEKTTEIELPWAKNSSTHTSSVAATTSVAASAKIQANERAKELALRQWIRDLDMNSPWVLRLLAVVAVLLLSLLVV